MSAGTRLAILLCLVPGPAAAQGFLEGFSYEGLRFAGIGAEVGVVMSDRLAADVIGSLRIDYGLIAPRVRTLVGVSYFRSRFDDAEIAEFERKLEGLVVTDAPFSIDAGEVTWTNVAVDLDLQYLFATRTRVVPYAGLGIGVHFRDAAGAAIDGTFVEDALQTVAAALNLSAGVEVGLVPSLAVTVDARGVLSSGLLAGTLRGGFRIRLPGEGE